MQRVRREQIRLVVSCVLAAMVLLFLFLLTIEREKKAERAELVSKTTAPVTEEQLRRVVPGTIMIDQWKNILVMKDPTYPGRVSLYFSNPGNMLHMDTDLLCKRIVRIVPESDVEYKKFAANFINNRKAQ